MTDLTSAETQVRNALLDLVPDDLDVSSFRSRLAAAIAGDSAGAASTEVESDPEPVELVVEPVAITTGWGGFSRRKRFGLSAAVAALAAAIAGALLVVVPQASNHPTPAGTTAAPAAIKPMLFPGTIVLKTYRGHGSATFQVARRTLPRHTAYSVYGTCAGGGNITIAKQMTTGPCSTGGAFGTSGVVDHDRLVITAAASTSWVLTLTIAPDSRTNAVVHSPIDDDMKPLKTSRAHTITPGRVDGRGTETVTLAQQPNTGRPYRIELVCHGTGVTIPTLHERDTKTKLVTKTCFAGNVYEWDILESSVPAHLKVDADPNTTWTIRLTE